MHKSELRKIVPISGTLSDHDFAKMLTFMQHHDEGEDHFTVNTSAGAICVNKNTFGYFGYEADDKQSYTGAMKARIKTGMFFEQVESKITPPTLLKPQKVAKVISL